MNQFYTLVTQHNNKIYDIGYNADGKKIIKKSNFKPVIGLESNEESKYKNIYGKSLSLKQFKDIKLSRDYINENKDLVSIYGDIPAEYQYINETYKDIKFDYSQLKVFFWDIEVPSATGFPFPNEAKHPITSIAIKDKHNDVFFVLSLKPYNKTKTILKIDPKTIRFKHCKSEEDLLTTFINLMRKEQPDILCGWFSNGFDNPYLINRCYNILSDIEVRKMSMFNKVYVRESDFQGKTDYHSTIGGIVLLDYLELYKKYTFKPRESYSLDFISDVELKDGKIKYDEYDNFIEFWEKDSQLFVDYNIQDVELIDLLDNHLDLINLHCNLSFKAKCNFTDALGTVRMWDILIYNYLKEKNIMIPPNISHDFKPFAGAYVKEPIKKIYDWVASIDLNSLYPHLIQQYNISPEKIIDGKCIPDLLYSKKLDERFLNQKFSVDPRAILAANGQYFNKDGEGFLPKIMRELYIERKEIKKEMLREKQKLVKIQEEIKRREKE